MTKKTQPFYEPCSKQTCTQTKQQVSKDYDYEYYKEHHMRPPQPESKGGAKTTVMEPAQIRIIGELGTFQAKKHGLAIETQRCRQFKYTDREGEPKNPTCLDKKVYNIPQRTIQCYGQFTELLNALSRGKKGAPPTTTHKILALLGCNKSDIGKNAVAEPLSPYLISAVTGIEHNAVRKTIENLVKSRKVTSSSPTLKVVDEKQNRLTPTYAKAFDQFVTSEKETRKWIAFRRLFGDEFTPVTAPELPEAQIYSVGKGFKKPKKLSKRAIAQAQREASEWAVRTGIGKWKPTKIRKAPRREGTPHYRHEYELEQALGVHL